MEDVWRCASLGKVTKASVTVGTLYYSQWHSGDFETDDGGRGEEIWSAFRSSLNLIPVGYLAFQLSTNFPKRESWCTAM
jgi:hypothetical protein